MMLFEKIYQIVYIFFLIFSSQKVSFQWQKKIYVYLTYIFKFERFLKTGIYLYV